MRFSVQGAQIGMIENRGFVWKPAFKVVGYQGAGINFPVESEATVDEAKALEWMAKAEAGDFAAEAKWGSYSDD